jgi:fatty-acyl-CoA synthase
MHLGLLHDGLAYWARRTPDKRAIVIDQDASITYRELHVWSDTLAVHLQKLGVTSEDVIAIAGSNSLRWAAAAFATMKVGPIVAPFNDRLVGEEFAYLNDLVAPRLIFADAYRAQVLRKAGVETPLLAIEDVDRFREPLASPPKECSVSSDAVAMVMFTSGSTARPKGAMMTHASYLAKFHEMRILDPTLGPDTSALMPFGLHASPGLAWGLLFVTQLGGTLHITEKYQAERTLRTLADEAISFFIGVPLIYDQVSQQPGFRDANLSALTFARVGGASASDAVLARWRDKGIIVRQLYGMSEMGGGSIIATQEEARARPQSCGRGLAFTKFRVVDAEGRTCAPGELGHVLLRGPGMMAGYWRDPEATAAAIVDGWMHTGDIGVVDEDGYFAFVDRAKEMIKTGGFNVSPAEIESVLSSLPDVVECAVFAVPDDTFGEAPFACVRLQGEFTVKAVFDHCASRLATFKLPRYILTLETPLPRLANEKIDRRALKAIYADPARRPAKIAARRT